MNKLTPKDFPKLLQQISDPPKQLYIEGEFPDEKKHTFLAVVGSRKYSHYGKEACEKLIAGLAGLPVVIISGLAIGMDSIAHRAALKTGLLTVAVPGSGLDCKVLYPAVNRGLAEEILKASGCILEA